MLWYKKWSHVRDRKPKIDHNQQTSPIKYSSTSSISQGYFHSKDFHKSISKVLVSQLSHPQLWFCNSPICNCFSAISLPHHSFSNWRLHIAGLHFSVSKMEFRKVLATTLLPAIRFWIADCVSSFPLFQIWASTIFLSQLFFHNSTFLRFNHIPNSHCETHFGMLISMDCYLSIDMRSSVDVHLIFAYLLFSLHLSLAEFIHSYWFV